MKTQTPKTTGRALELLHCSSCKTRTPHLHGACGFCMVQMAAYLTAIKLTDDSAPIPAPVETGP